MYASDRIPWTVSGYFYPLSLPFSVLFSNDCPTASFPTTTKVTAKVGAATIKGCIRLNQCAKGFHIGFTVNIGEINLNS